MEKSILLVEDDYLDIMSVQRALKKLNINHHLDIAHNGKEALAMLKGEGVPKVTRPHLILLDLNMPKMNGLEFLKELRNEPEFSRIDVFIMTTSNEEYDRLNAQGMGISGYIIKPLTFDDYGNPVSSMDTFDLLLKLMKN